MTPILLARRSHLAATGYGMFGFYDDAGGHPAPPPSRGWFSASPGEVHIRPNVDLPEPAIRFELWTDTPPEIHDAGDVPELEAHLAFQATRGSIALTAIAAGAEPEAFTLPPGRYHLLLSGYRRSRIDEEAGRLHRSLGPGDPEFDALAGTELYVARFWPAEDELARALAAAVAPGVVRDGF